MNLLNELLNLSESNKETTLVGLTINDKLVTDETKNEIWSDDFNCINNYNLTSLEGAPKEVDGDFNCINNPKLKSLVGSPDKVHKDFYCNRNHNLTSLEGSPKEVFKVFNCSDNRNLVSLEGAPKEVGGSFFCSDNPKLTSLKGIHKQVIKLGVTLDIGAIFFAYNTPIKSHVLGLLLIKGCKSVRLDNKEVQKILNKYLPNTRGNKGLIECQSELLDAGLEDFAEL